jgi:hypothetical protein
MAAGKIAEEYKKILWNYGGTSDEIFNRGWRHMIGIASLQATTYDHFYLQPCQERPMKDPNQVCNRKKRT